MEKVEQGLQNAEERLKEAEKELRVAGTEEDKNFWRVMAREKEVNNWGEQLRQLRAQPGNNFVTRALGHRVVCI